MQRLLVLAKEVWAIRATLGEGPAWRLHGGNSVNEWGKGVIDIMQVS